MSLADQPLRAIVLAGQRKGVVNPLAERFGASHKCFIPLAGRPLIAHVLRTLADHPRVGEIAISVEPEVFDELYDVLTALPGRSCVRFVAARDNLADSVIAACDGNEGPFLITTADHALLSPASIDAMADALAKADVAVAMARREQVLAAHPQGQRRFYEFADDGYSNCNLYGIANREALRSAELFRGGGQFAKSARRIVRAFGLVNLMLLRLRAVSLATGLARVSRRIGARIAPVVLTDGSQAIDVDNDRTYAVVEELLARREASARADAGARPASGVPYPELAPRLSLVG